MRNPRTSDAPVEIEAAPDSSREELLGGKSPRPGVLGAYDIAAVVLGIAAVALAAATLDSWPLLVVLGAIVVVVIGFMIAVSPNRRA